MVMSRYDPEFAKRFAPEPTAKTTKQRPLAINMELPKFSLSDLLTAVDISADV